jgi:transcriptional regulator of acetoin/glycerol metabolism
MRFSASRRLCVSVTVESASTHLRRLENLDELLPTLAGVLDIREVFERVSAVARRVLPHDKSKAAKLLGLSRKQLYVRLRQHGLE